jgi:hypothetical protein
MERVRNAPAGILEFINHEYEEHTSDWEIVFSDEDFTMWKYFDGPAWADHYCACYKGKAYVVGELFGAILDKHETARMFFNFLPNVQ